MCEGIKKMYYDNKPVSEDLEGEDKGARYAMMKQEQGHTGDCKTHETGHQSKGAWIGFILFLVASVLVQICRHFQCNIMLSIDTHMAHHQQKKR